MFDLDAALFFADGAAAQLAGQPVRGHLDAPYAIGAATGPGGMAGDRPQFTLPTANVPPGVEGAMLDITEGQGAGRYTVRAHLPGGDGISALDLDAAP